MFTMVLMSTGCEKDSTTPDKTLAQQHPNWKNLTWESTDNLILECPKLAITIVGNVATIYETTYNPQTRLLTPYVYQYDGLDITATSATFFLPQTGAITQTMTIMTPPDNTKIKLSWQNHVYVLKIN